MFYIGFNRESIKQYSQSCTLSSVTCLKFAPKWSFSYFQPIFAAIFVTIANVKVESIRELNTLAIVLIN